MSSQNTVLFPVRGRQTRGMRADPSDGRRMGLLLIGLIGGVTLGFVLARRDLRQRLGRRLASLGRSSPLLPGGGREPDIHMSPSYGTQTSPTTR